MKTQLALAVALLASTAGLAAAPPAQATTTLCGGWSPWIPKWANTGFTG